MAPATGTDDLKMQRDHDVRVEDQLAVLGEFFPHLNNPQSMRDYFAASTLGEAFKWMLRWQDTPASHWSVFPFPYAIDGKRVISGKPEASAINPALMYRTPRPDLFGAVQDALIEHCRVIKWPLLVGMTTPLQRKSMKKKGFVNVEMPVLRAYWPLKAQQTRPLIQMFIERNFPRLDAKMPAFVKSIFTRLAAYPLTWRSRLKAGVGSVRLAEIPCDKLSEHAVVLEQNYWPKQRVTVWRDAVYWQQRLTALPGHRILRAEYDGKIGIVLTRLVDGDLRLQDVLPPDLMTQPDFWRALLHYALSIGAGIVTMNFYLNDPFQAQAVEVVKRSVPPVLRSTPLIYSVLALDDQYKFAYDPTAWAGTNMLMAGF